jgi:hypothetical protein
MQFGLAPHSGTIFWMRELRSSGQTKVQRMLNVPERSSVYDARDAFNQVSKAVTISSVVAIALLVISICETFHIHNVRARNYYGKYL